MAGIVAPSLLNYFTDTLSEDHMGTIYIGPKPTEEYSQQSIQLQWIVLNLISLRVLDNYLVLRLDTRPPGLYYREWWWKIGSDIAYQLCQGGGDNTYMDAMFLRRHIDFVARLCPNGFPESEAARRLDMLAHTIGAKMKAGLVMEEGRMRIVFRRWLNGYGLGYVTYKKEQEISPEKPASSAAVMRLPGKRSCLKRGFLELEWYRPPSGARSRSVEYFPPTKYDMKRLEEGLIYQELASDAALGRLPGMGIVRSEE